MCDPITLIGLAIGGASTALLASQSTPGPPAAKTPAIPAPEGRTPGATVRLGSSSDDISNDLNPEGDRKAQVPLARTSSNTLGNLGRSTLAI